jgi:hypothetical protein
MIGIVTTIVPDYSQFAARRHSDLGHKLINSIANCVIINANGRCPGIAAVRSFAKGYIAGVAYGAETGSIRTVPTRIVPDRVHGIGIAGRDTYRREVIDAEETTTISARDTKGKFMTFIV